MPFAEETDIRIDFQTALSVRKFDNLNHGLSHCMKAVDFIVELSDRILFIEIKDPENPNALQRNRNKFIKELESDKLIKSSLVPKCRDSFLYEYCMERIHKPFHYYVIIGLDSLSDAELITQSDLLDRNIPITGSSMIPWKRSFIKKSHIFNLRTWNSIFKEFPITRLSHQQN
ncbi:MAG: hypothetical protein Q8O92_09215 [Candidatus Latescibacter sp.]|nr:hypothetical protein [Candidatus Latescibacter sp.]